MATKTQTVTLHTEAPVRLFQELEFLVQSGWSRNLDEVIHQVESS